ELLPTLDVRHRVIRFLRTFRPDLVLTHRPNDYHPDHRYTAQLVQDAAYMVTVPAVCPEVPYLPRNPVILYLSDDFRRPAPFSPDVVVAVGDELEVMVDMLHRHASQFYEWLPFNAGHADAVPHGEWARRAWLAAQTQARLRALADRCRPALVRAYGPERG